MMSSVKSRFSGLVAASTLVLGACATTGATPEAPIDLATDEQRAAAERADPLTRARFWAAEYEKEPENIGTAKHFAKALRQIESHDRVIQVVSDTLILYPADYDLLMLLGRSYLSLNKVDGASQSFGRAISVDNSRPDAFAALGLTYDRAAQHEFAQRAYSKALEIDPNRTATLTNYGLSLALSGDISAAENNLRKAAGRPDANSQVRQNLALVLGLQGKFEEMKTVDSTAPSSVMEQNAKLLKNMIQQNVPVSAASISTEVVPTPAEKIDAAPTTPVTTAALTDLPAQPSLKSEPAIVTKPAPVQKPIQVTKPVSAKTVVAQVATQPKSLIKPPAVKPVPATPARSSKERTVEAILATVPKVETKPVKEVQTVRLPGGLRGSLPD